MEPAANTIRLTAVTYPSGRVLNYNYGTSGGTNDLLSRVGSLIDNNGTTHLADYTYLGLERIVQDSYTTEPAVELTYIKQPGESNGDAGDQYTGLDRFGRAVDQRWIPITGSSSSSAAAAIVRVDYGYDQDNNRQWRNNLAAGTGQDEYYTYDGLQRLLTLQRGTLNGGKTGISGTPGVFAKINSEKCRRGFDGRRGASDEHIQGICKERATTPSAKRARQSLEVIYAQTPNWEEDFAFDPTGNWNGTSSSSSGGYVTKVSGTITLSQNRTHTKANEITAIPTATGTGWQVPAYDSNGNATTIPQPASLGSGYTCAYDAWNRLMSVKNGATTVSSYQYDGLNRRTQKSH